MLGDEPVELGPAFELDHLASRGLGQALETRLGGQGEVDAARTKEKPNLLTASVSS